MTPQDFENGLSIVGVTAVEDLLQERVSESIRDFKEAGMKVWMLTGDKGATAKMIGIQCDLIPQSSLRFIHSKETSYGNSVLVEFRETCQKTEIVQEVERINGLVSEKEYQLMIEGSTMAAIVEDQSIQTEACQLLLKADSVILYRSSPS